MTAAQCRDGPQRPLIEEVPSRTTSRPARRRGSRTRSRRCRTAPRPSPRSRGTPSRRRLKDSSLSGSPSRARTEDSGVAGIDQVVLRLRDRALVDLVLDLVDADDDERRAATRGTSSDGARRPRRWRPRSPTGWCGFGLGRAGMRLALRRRLAASAGRPSSSRQCRPTSARGRSRAGPGSSRASPPWRDGFCSLRSVSGVRLTQPHPASRSRAVCASGPGRPTAGTGAPAGR